MPAHPLFDERVVDCLRAVADEVIRCMPESVAAVELVLRPGEADPTVDITFPDSPPPANWEVPESIVQAGRDLATTWNATGQPMPAFRFSHRRDEQGLWQASMEPLLEW